MNRKQVIDTLKMENDLICFNPSTGEEIPLEYVNDLNKNCYDAHQEAIRLINNSIPIEWIKKWRRDKWLGGEPIEKRTIMAMGVRLLLEDWEKENENN